MASTYSAVLLHGLTTTETLSGNDLAAQSQLIHSGFTEQITLTSASSPDIVQPAYQTFTLSSGAATIDLTAIQLNGNNQTFSGKKLRYIKVKALSGNSNNITVAVGGSNGYTGMGSSFSCTLPPGGSFSFYDGGNCYWHGGKFRPLPIQEFTAFLGQQVVPRHLISLQWEVKLTPFWISGCPSG